MKVSVVTLGCKVNKYESDALIFELKNKGYEVSDKIEFADFYIINSCAVTGEAEKKSRQMIARCKKFNPHAKVFVCGCASQHNPIKFKEKNVEYVSGTSGKIKIISRLEECGLFVEDVTEVYEDNLKAYQNRTRAFIKIQDGCNNFCTYCIIPYLRGRSRSRNIESILKEVSELSDEVKEIVLVGINVTDFKVDGEKGLITLLERLDTFGKRIRLSSMEDTLIDEKTIERMSKLKNFCPHFHLSLQSGSDEILKKMNRNYTSQEFLNTTKIIRKYFKNAGLTTDVIVGFPDETEQNFQETVELIKNVGFSALHIFPYSNREGTVASKIFKDMPYEIKKERVKFLEKIDKELKLKFYKNNKYGSILFEEKEGDFFVGYTENYIKCYCESQQDLTNQVLDVEILQPYLEGVKVKLKLS